MYSDKYKILVYEVEAPLMDRYKRYKDKYNLETPLEDFIALDDQHRSANRFDNGLNVK